MTDSNISVLFVCMGNICRSPTAEGVFRALVEEAGLKDRIEIDSAGTHAYHVGNPPDARAQEAARKRGYDLSDQRARQVTAEDCERFDYVLAMDSENLARLRELCDGDGSVRRFLDLAENTDVRDVPDPYYGGRDGFDRVLDLVEDGALGLLQDVEDHLASQGQ